jgi:hypothetical protein
MLIALFLLTSTRKTDLVSIRSKCCAGFINVELMMNDIGTRERSFQCQPFVVLVFGAYGIGETGSRNRAETQREHLHVSISLLRQRTHVILFTGRELCQVVGYGQTMPGCDLELLVLCFLSSTVVFAYALTCAAQASQLLLHL